MSSFESTISPQLLRRWWCFDSPVDSACLFDIPDRRIFIYSQCGNEIIAHPITLEIEPKSTVLKVSQAVPKDQSYSRPKTNMNNDKRS